MKSSAPSRSPKEMRTILEYLALQMQQEEPEVLRLAVCLLHTAWRAKVAGQRLALIDAGGEVTAILTGY